MTGGLSGDDGAACWGMHSPEVVSGGRGRCNEDWTCLRWSVYTLVGIGNGDRIARIGCSTCWNLLFRTA